jgi:dihydroneopterin aldolase
MAKSSHFPHCRLEILEYEIPVHLGCTEAERANPQSVAFDTRIAFAETPPGTQTDRIGDTLCYASVCETIRATAQGKSWNLIEALGRAVYEALHASTRIDCGIEISVHKLHPPVEHLRGGSRFVYGDRLP